MESMEYMSRAVKYFLADESGSSFLEYMLVGLLFAIVSWLAVLALSKSM